MKIVDVNILVYIASKQSPQHEVLNPWWEQLMNGQEIIGLCWHSLVGFIRVMTHPKIMPNPVPLKDCLDRVNLWIDQRATQLIHENESNWSAYQSLLLDSNAIGKLSTDAHLAALAISRGATLVSCDTDFARFRHLRWENPLV